MSDLCASSKIFIYVFFILMFVYWLSVQVVAAKRILENKYITAQQASDEWWVHYVYLVFIESGFDVEAWDCQGICMFLFLYRLLENDCGEFAGINGRQEHWKEGMKH